MATVKANGLTYRLLKGQILKEIDREGTDWTENYPYRLNQINVFDNRRITHLEAEELRLLIEPYKTEVEE